MSSVLKFAKTIRNNWKKSVVLVAAVAYGCKYGERKFRLLINVYYNLLMIL